jgi:hypothetical protein
MNVSPFLWKTFSLVSDPATDAIVSWSPDGMTFTVWKPDVMVRPRERGRATRRRRAGAGAGRPEAAQGLDSRKSTATATAWLLSTELACTSRTASETTITVDLRDEESRKTCT